MIPPELSFRLPLHSACPCLTLNVTALSSQAETLHMVGSCPWGSKALIVAAHNPKEEETLSLPVPNKKPSKRTLPSLKSMCFEPGYGVPIGQT